jgi:hypothetical protein
MVLTSPPSKDKFLTARPLLPSLTLYDISEPTGIWTCTDAGEHADPSRTIMGASEAGGRSVPLCSQVNLRSLGIGYLIGNKDRASWYSLVTIVKVLHLWRYGAVHRSNSCISIDSILLWGVARMVKFNNASAERLRYASVRERSKALSRMTMSHHNLGVLRARTLQQ